MPKTVVATLSRLSRDSDARADALWSAWCAVRRYLPIVMTRRQLEQRLDDAEACARRLLLDARVQPGRAAQPALTVVAGRR